MSNNPYSSPATSPGGIPPGAAPGASLPGLVIVLAIVGLIIGGLNFFGSCCGLAGVAGFSAMANSTMMKDALQEAAADDPQAAKAAADFEKAKDQIAGNFVPLLIQLVLGLALGAGLLFGAIGTLMKKEWGRNFLVLSCMAGVAIAVVGFLISYMTGNFGGNLADLPAESRTVAMVSMAIGIGLTVVYIAYYVFTWRYLSAPERRAYFS